MSSFARSPLEQTTGNLYPLMSRTQCHIPFAGTTAIPLDSNLSLIQMIFAQFWQGAAWLSITHNPSDPSCAHQKRKLSAWRETGFVTRPAVGYRSDGKENGEKQNFLIRVSLLTAQTMVRTKKQTYARILDHRCNMNRFVCGHS